MRKDVLSVRAEGVKIRAARRRIGKKLMKERVVPCLWPRLAAVVVLAALAVAGVETRRVTAQSGGNRTLRLAPAGTVAEWPASAKRYALVIGVDEYADKQITTLGGASNDAKALAEALVKYAGFPADQVVVLASDAPTERQPTRGNILRRMSNLRSAIRQAGAQDGLLVVAFSGHGMDRDGRAFLLPSDAQVADDVHLLEQTAVDVQEMRRSIEATGVAQVVMLLDACRNDPSAGRADSVNALSETYTRGFDFERANSGIEAYVTLYATSVGARAYEYSEKKQGYFTWALVNGLAGAAADDKGRVTLGSLVKYVQEAVPKRVALDLGAGKVQVPRVEMARAYRADDLVVAAVRSAPEATATKPAPSPASSTTAKPQMADRPIDLGGGVLLEMVLVPAGSFDMGSGTGFPAEKPVHRVTISKPFYIGKYEVTQGQWKAVMGTTPSYFTGSDDLPVEQVSWEDCQEFVRRLGARTGLAFRLPTEAEWEYACRAGTSEDYAGVLDKMAWFGDNSGRSRLNAEQMLQIDGPNFVKHLLDNGCRTHPVGRKSPNAWGLYDMHGNVWEWCADWLDEHYFSRSPSADPGGPSEGVSRVLRGGSWHSGSVTCRSAHRAASPSSLRTFIFGFRLARTQ
jgi:formylglycine-generating enzyme required for sulfatase activity/uncharacterized caspase-like protein